MVVNTNAQTSGDDDAYGHDHYFNFRLDIDVDGPVNRFQADRLETARLPETHPRSSLRFR